MNTISADPDLLQKISEELSRERDLISRQLEAQKKRRENLKKKNSEEFCLMVSFITRLRNRGIDASGDVIGSEYTLDIFAYISASSWFVWGEETHEGIFIVSYRVLDKFSLPDEDVRLLAKLVSKNGKLAELAKNDQQTCKEKFFSTLKLLRWNDYFYSWTDYRWTDGPRSIATLCNEELLARISEG